MLAMAGVLKRQRGHAAEAGLLVEALTNSNLPKLLATDAALFNALLADLFPHTPQAPRVSSGEHLPAQGQGRLPSIHLRSSTNAYDFSVPLPAS